MMLISIYYFMFIIVVADNEDYSQAIKLCA
jgi:hypothetical protein